MDSDGDGSVTLNEMMAALKECWAVNLAVASKDRPEAVDVLIKASVALRKDKVWAATGVRGSEGEGGKGRDTPSDSHKGI